MMRSNSAAILSLPIPDDLREFFAQRPIVFGESPELYDILLSRVAAEAKPEDPIEWLLFKDVVDLTWEIQRFRKFQVALLQNDLEGYVVRYLEISRPRSLDVDDSAEPSTDELIVNYDHMVSGYFAGDPKAKSEVAAILAEKNIELDFASLLMRAFGDNKTNLEYISRMTAAVEARRERVLRQIDLRRHAFIIRLRLALDTENGSIITPASETRQLVSTNGNAL